MNLIEIFLFLVLPIGLVLLFFAWLGWFSYNATFRNDPVKNPPNPYRHVKGDGSFESEFSKRLIDEMIARPSENVYITSRDGLKLRARLYMQDENAPFVLAMHGYRSTPMLDFSGGAPLMMRLGFNVLMPDQRACGESEGRVISFGYNESIDTLDWIKFIKDRWGEDRKTVLIGVSLGASTVIMAAGRGLPKNVKGVIADCPYSSAKRIIMKVMRDRRVPAHFVYPFLRIATKILGGFDPDKIEVSAYAKNIKVPLMLIHGEGDGFVPTHMSREISDATPGAELHTFPEAAHAMSYIKDVERYEKITSEFLKDVIGSDASLND